MHLRSPRRAALAASLALAAAGVVSPPAARAQQGAQPVDTQYTRIIRELTPTDPRWKFTTELVNYLPASATVPAGWCGQK